MSNVEFKNKVTVSELSSIKFKANNNDQNTTPNYVATFKNNSATNGLSWTSIDDLGSRLGLISKNIMGQVSQTGSWKSFSVHHAHEIKFGNVLFVFFTFDYSAGGGATNYVNINHNTGTVYKYGYAVCTENNGRNWERCGSTSVNAGTQLRNSTTSDLQIELKCHDDNGAGRTVDVIAVFFE